LHTNCLLKHVIEGKIEGGIEVMVRRGGRLNQLLDDLNKLEMERRSTKWGREENSPWKSAMDMS
jgi:hypothetical protein